MISIRGRMAGWLGIFSVTTVWMFDSSAKDYYVSPTGDDGNAGTLESPWKGIFTAITRCAPGDSVILRGGNYDEGEIWLNNKAWSGQPGKLKVVRSMVGEIASLGGQRRLINQIDWIRYEGLHFRLPYIFDNNSGDHVQVAHCEFVGHQPDYAAISFRGNHGLIEGNTIHITGDTANTLDHGIYLLHGSDNVLRGNAVFNATGYGIHIYDERKSEDPTTYVRRFQNILIEGNFVIGSRHRSGIIAAVQTNADMKDIVIRQNVLAANNHVGLVLGRATGIRVERNTFHNNGRQGMFVGKDAKEVSIRDNLFVQEPSKACGEFCSWFQERHVGLEPGASSPSVERNCYWPNGVKSDGPLDPTALRVEPVFADTSTLDLRQRDSSPANGFGALPQESILGLRQVDWDPVARLIRVQITGRPGQRLQMESVSDQATFWRKTGPILEISPAGAIFTDAVREEGQTRLYRARVIE